MITFDELNKTPRNVLPTTTKTPAEQFLEDVESKIKFDFSEGKEFTEIKCQNDIIHGQHLKKYLKSFGYKVELRKIYDNYYQQNVPDTLKIWLKK